MTYYQQVAWQLAKTTATVTPTGEPVENIADTITATIDSNPSTYNVQATDKANQYSLQIHVYEATPIVSPSKAMQVDWMTTGENVTLTPAGETIVLIDPATLSTETQYCTIEELYRWFGSENVNVWADKNNLRDTEEITNAIIDSIVIASSRVNALMRDKYYAIPFSPIPAEIMQATRLMAGYELHASRGIEDSDGTIKAAKMEANSIIKQILAGQILFDLPTNQRA